MTERQAALTGWREYELRRKGHEEAAREEWERIRWKAWRDILLSPHIKRLDKPRSPKAFLRFPWEEPEDDELRRKAEDYRVSPEEEAELNRIFNELENRERQGDGEIR